MTDGKTDKDRQERPKRPTFITKDYFLKNIQNRNSANALEAEKKKRKQGNSKEISKRWLKVITQNHS